MIDEGFAKRIYITAFVFAAFVLAMLLAYRVEWAITLGVLLGFALGVLSLWTIEIVVERLLQPGHPKAAGRMVMLGLGKWSVIGAGLYFIARSEAVNLLAFAAALAVVPFVIVMKALGSCLSGQSSSRGAGGR